MPSIDIHGAKVHYHEVGEGQTVMLVHGSACSGQQWTSLMDQLKDRFRLVAPDLWGYGDSQPWTGGGNFNLRTETLILERLLENTREPIHLVGHSYGGAVALQFALDHPERIATLTLFEPVAFHLLRHCHPALYQEVRDLASQVREAVLAGDLKGGMGCFVDYWNGEGTWAGVPEEKQTQLARRTNQTVLNFDAGAEARDLFASHRRLASPTLLMRGESTPAPTQFITGLLNHSLPNAQMTVVEGAGHMAPITHGDVVNREIVAHINGTLGWGLAA